MTNEDASQNELAHQQSLLNTPLGIPGSGYTRYGAAMWLFKQGRMTHQMLEAYRVCCKFDHDDPMKVDIGS